MLVTCDALEGEETSRKPDDTWIHIGEVLPAVIGRICEAYVNASYYDPIVPAEPKQAEAGPQ